MIRSHINRWQEIKNATMTTIGKDSGKAPSSLWKKTLLISEHSPIRKLTIAYKWEKIKYWVSVHITRHKFGIEHFVSTQRTDRTGLSRDELTQDSIVAHEFEANGQAIINISRKRLCLTASAETTEAWKEALSEIKDREPELYFVSVPECVYRGGCSQKISSSNTCSYYEKFKKIARESDIDLSNIMERYTLYNAMRIK